MDPHSHWDAVFQHKLPEEMSWYQAEPRVSLELIREAVPDSRASILDVGGGASNLVDHLVASGYQNVAVLDISGTALAQSRRRLGPVESRITWLEADILTTAFAPAALDVWHDRAVFHFLTHSADRQRYVTQVRRATRPGGHVLVATFAEDGPTRCSGLQVVRYSADQLHGEFGSGFRLLSSRRETHVTPWGASQEFTYCLCRWEPPTGEET